MKHILTRTLSVFLTVIITLSSVQAGISGVDFNGSFVVKTKAVSESELTFHLNFDGNSYSVVDCNVSADGEIIIPEMYNNLPVIRIGREAFKNCTKITTVTIGNRITTIGDNAFENCSSLETVAFPDTVTYSKNSTMIVNDCQNIDDWKMSASADCEADSQNYISGTQSIHSSSGTMVCTKDTYDMLNNNLVLNLRINSMSDGASLYMQICNNSDTSKYVVYQIMRGHSTTPMGSWREITVPYTGYFQGKFNEIDFTKIDNIKFYVVGGDVDWNLQYIGIKPVIADKGIVSFTFDDGYKSQYTGLEILGKKGIKGTLFYAPEANTNGSADYLKINDLQELVKLYGTDVEVHGASSYNDKTNEELIEHWENTQKLFKENGLGEGRHMAYPNSMHDDRVVNLAKNYFDSCRTIQSYIPIETYLPGDKYRIRAISCIGASGNNVKYVKDKIDRVADSKSWLILTFHRIEDGNTTMYCSESDIAAIADYALASDVEIKTIAEVMDSTAAVGNSTGSISVGAYAFYSCEKLKRITIPESVKQIGEKAFGYYNEYGETSEKVEDFVITGIKNSVAHSYSEDSGVTFDIICEEHIISDWIIDKNATCVEEGLRHKECTFCEDVLEIEKIVKEVHTASDWFVDEKATCTQEGLKHKECTECKEVLETETIAKKGHTAGSWKTEKKATVNSAGKKVKKCTECGKTLDTATIKQLKCSKPKLSKIENTSSGVKITWGKVSGADKYYVYRKTSSGKYTKIGTTTKTYYTDKKASSGKKYYYIVKAVNEAGSSDSSSSKSIVYLADTTLKTPSSTKKGIVLKWSKVTGADGYMVYRKTGSGSYSKIATVKGSKKVTYTDKKAKKGKTYTYKVKAYKSKTYSAYSNAKKIKDKY